MEVNTSRTSSETGIMGGGVEVKVESMSKIHDEQTDESNEAKPGTKVEDYPALVTGTSNQAPVNLQSVNLIDGVTDSDDEIQPEAQEVHARSRMKTGYYADIDDLMGESDSDD